MRKNFAFVLGLVLTCLTSVSTFADTKTSDLLGRNDGRLLIGKNPKFPNDSCSAIVKIGGDPQYSDTGMDTFLYFDFASYTPYHNIAKASDFKKAQFAPRSVGEIGVGGDGTHYSLAVTFSYLDSTITRLELFENGVLSETCEF